MPAAALPRILAVEVGALAPRRPQRRLRATLRGKLEGLARLPAALRERRRLAATGDLAHARAGSAAAAEPRPRSSERRRARRSAAAAPAQGEGLAGAEVEQRRRAAVSAGRGPAPARKPREPARQSLRRCGRGAAGRRRSRPRRRAPAAPGAGPASRRSGAACSRGSSRCARTWRRSPRRGSPSRRAGRAPRPPAGSARRAPPAAAPGRGPRSRGRSARRNRRPPRTPRGGRAPRRRSGRADRAPRRAPRSGSPCRWSKPIRVRSAMTPAESIRPGSRSCTSTPATESTPAPSPSSSASTKRGSASASLLKRISGSPGCAATARFSAAPKPRFSPSAQQRHLGEALGDHRVGAVARGVVDDHDVDLPRLRAEALQRPRQELAAVEVGDVDRGSHRRGAVAQRRPPRRALAARRGSVTRQLDESRQPAQLALELGDLGAQAVDLGRRGRRRSVAARRGLGIGAGLAQDRDDLRLVAGEGLDLEAIVEALAAVQQQRQEGRRGEGVGVDRELLGFELAGELLRPLGKSGAFRSLLVAQHRGAVFVVVPAARALRPLSVVADHVVERRHLTPEVEGVALVGHRVEEDAARLQLGEVHADRPDRVAGVLEEVVGDDEVLGVGRDRLQPFAVVDHVDRRQVHALQLRVGSAQLRGRQPVHVARRRPARDGEAAVERADLETVAAQVAEGEFGAGVEVGRRRGRGARGGKLGAGSDGFHGGRVPGRRTALSFLE